MTKLVKRCLAERFEYIVALHIDDCPIPAREWEGKPYANVLDDCVGCPFCAGIVEDDDVPDEAETIQCVMCPESLTEDEKANPKLWGWRGPDGSVSDARTRGQCSSASSLVSGCSMRYSPATPLSS